MLRELVRDLLGVSMKVVPFSRDENLSMETPGYRPQFQRTGSRLSMYTSSGVSSEGKSMLSSVPERKSIHTFIAINGPTLDAVLTLRSINVARTQLGCLDC